jgi:hypothetical protein
MYNCHNSGHYPSSCFFYINTTFRGWIVSSSSDGTYSFGPNRADCPEASFIYLTQVIRFHLETETEFILRNVAF